MNMIAPVAPGTVGTRSVDVTRGTSSADVSRQWFSRPDDQRFLSLNDLAASVNRRREVSFEEIAPVSKLHFAHNGSGDVNTLKVITPEGRTVMPTHHSFGQICSLLKAPAPYLRGMHALRAAANLNSDLLTRGEDMPLKIYGESDQFTLRAMTGTEYGRIYDAELVAAVQKVAGDGVGSHFWKVPGALNWANMTYSPWVDVTKETTTLYASDRDVFMFLVDDTRPVEVGKLANGDPDLLFRGFYASNSEVGTRSLSIKTFWLRGVCQNRICWGVEDMEDLRVIHSKHGALRFIREAEPALERYALSSPTKFLQGIKTCKETVIGKDDDERVKLLKSLDFSDKMSKVIIETHEREEGRPMESVWDAVQGITAVARGIPNTDKRLDFELVAGRLMDRATRNKI